MPKENVEINSFINEFYVKTIITQKIRNETESPLEIQIHFDQKEKSLFTSFSAKIGDLIQVKSKIIKLKKAEEKYTDNISSGNGAIFVCRDPYYKNRIIINMGNIPPKQDLIFTSEHIQYLESSDKFYFEFFKNLPIIDCKNESIYFSPEITGKVEIKMKNKIKICNKYFSNDLNIIEEKFIENENYYLIKYNFTKSTDIDDDIENIKGYKRKDSDDDIKKNKINKLYFEIEQNPLIIYSQKSLLKENEKNFIIQYKYIENSFKKKPIDNLKLSPALFIFLVDQSCSMRDEPIRVTCKALVLFLQSLPPGSYYQLIGFGTEYVKYNSKPIEYTQDNVKNSISRAQYLQANLGGTDLYHPIKDIYKSHEIYDNINLPKNIFILTDGETYRKKDTLKLIEDNNNEFNVYSIGIGDCFDPDFIKQAGILGKGHYNFCEDISNLKNIIANEIKNASKPYIVGLNIKSSLDSNYSYNVNDKSLILKNNHFYYYKFIVDDKNGDIEKNKLKLQIEYIWSDKDKQIENYEITIDQLQSDEILSKLIINEYILENKNLKEEDIIKLALEYQILSNYTSLYTEFEFSEKVSEEMKLIIIGDEKNNIIKNDELSELLDLISEQKKIIEQTNDELIIMKDQVGVSYASFESLSKIENIEKEGKKGVSSFFKNIGKSIKNIFSSKSNNEIIPKEKKIKINDKDIVEKIVDTQNFVEGYWDLNEITELIKDKYKKTFNLLKGLKDKNIDDRVAITILTIYFITKEHSELLNELVMIIQKAKIFVNNEIKDSYESITKLIGIN